MMEPESYQRFRRHVAAMADHADDAEGFAQLIELGVQLAEATGATARRLNAEGLSWAEMARPLGITRQATHRRYT